MCNWICHVFMFVEGYVHVNMYRTDDVEVHGDQSGFKPQGDMTKIILPYDMSVLIKLITNYHIIMW